MDYDLVRGYLSGFFHSFSKIGKRASDGHVENYSVSNYIYYETYYLDEDRPESKEARKHLIAILRSGSVPADILSSLADLFEDDSISERKITFNFKHRGARKRGLRDLHLVMLIEREMSGGGSVEAAIGCVSAETGVLEEALWKIWKQHAAGRRAQQE